MGVHCMIYMTNEEKASRKGLHQCIGSADSPSRVAEAYMHIVASAPLRPNGASLQRASHARVMCVSNPSEFRAQGRKRVLLRGAVRCLLTVQMLISCLVLLMDDKVSIQGSLAGFPRSDGVNCFSWFLSVFIK